MLKSPNSDEQYQSVVYTLTAVKTIPSNLQSAPKQIPNLASIPPQAPVILTPLHNPSTTSKRNKPATVREMLRTKKLERQRQLQQQQLLQRQQQEQQERLLQQQGQQQQQRGQYQRQPAYQVIQQPSGIMDRFGVNRSKGHSSSGKSSRVPSGKKKGRPLIPKSSVTDDKKEIHRLNERHRHRNMNQIIRQLVTVLPKNPAPETETKQFILQKAGDYISYLKEKIEGACVDLDVVQDNNEEGLMSFDMPFENRTGLRQVRVPASKPITPSDLQGLLGPTSALRLSDLPNRKTIPKTEQKLKPAKQTHQPWLEINIKMNMNEYKSGRGQKKSSTGRKKGARSKKRSSQKVSRGRQSKKHNDLSGWADIEDRPRSHFKQGQDMCQSSMASESSDALTQSDNQSWKRLSDYRAVAEEQDGQQEDTDSDDDEDIDLTCVDVLSDDDEDAVVRVKMEKENTIKSSADFGLDKKTSPPSQQVPSWIRYGSSNSPLTQDLDSKLRYRSSTSPLTQGLDSKLPRGSSPSAQGQISKLHHGSSSFPSAQDQDSKLQMEHSYSARELSPRTLQALAQFETIGEPLDDDKGHVASQQIGMEMIDDVLKAIVLEAPPDECVPPQSPSVDSKVYVFQAYGLDFDDDDDSGSTEGLSSQSSISPRTSQDVQQSSSTIPDNQELVVDSFGSPGNAMPELPTMRRSWINGYQLFTKINHPRVKRFWPGLHGREITRLLGYGWKDLSDESKKLYSVRACVWNQWYRQIRNQQKTED